MQRLVAMGLDRQPSAEFLASGLTADTWCDALWPGREWVRERDEARIGEGFRRLVRTARRWPVPAEFAEAMPRLVDAAPPQLAHDAAAEARRECGMRAMADLTKQFSWLRHGDA